MNDNFASSWAATDQVKPGNQPTGLAVPIVEVYRSIIRHQLGAFQHLNVFKSQEKSPYS